ncbi:hypothetical protein LINPERPRIM_LOCUS23892 [Linum perenne]
MRGGVPLTLMALSTLTIIALQREVLFGTMRGS